MRDKYHIKTDKKVFLYPIQWKQFYELLTDKQRPYFKFVINTGGRINEILNVTPNDVAEIEGMRALTFRITKVKAKKKQTRPEPRTIQISSEFFSWTQRYIKRERIKTNESIVKISKSAVHKIIKEKLNNIRKDSNDFSSHNLRKTHGNWLLALGVEGLEIANRLGHDMNTLLYHYASPTLFTSEHRIRIIDELGDLYKDLRRI